MALSFLSCADNASACDIVIRGYDVIIYDPNGEVCQRVNFANGAGTRPVNAYWSGTRVIVENDRGGGWYITNCGIGSL